MTLTLDHKLYLSRHACRTIIARFRRAANWVRNLDDADDLLSAVKFLLAALSEAERDTVELRHTLDRLRRLGELCLKNDLGEIGSEVLRQIAEGD